MQDLSDHVNSAALVSTCVDWDVFFIHPHTPWHSGDSGQWHKWGGGAYLTKKWGLSLKVLRDHKKPVSCILQHVNRDLCPLHLWWMFAHSELSLPYLSFRPGCQQARYWSFQQLSLLERVYHSLLVFFLPYRFFCSIQPKSILVNVIWKQKAYCILKEADGEPGKIIYLVTLFFISPSSL